MMYVQYDYIQLVKLLENFADEHLMIQRFASDFEDQFDVLCTTGNTYPFMFVAPVDGTAGVAVSNYRFKVFVVDQIQKDRSNVSSILNESSFVLGNLKVWLSEVNDSTPVISMTDPTMIPLNSFGVDFLAGHYAEFDIEFDTPGLCDIPFDNSPVVSGWTCDVEYTNSYLTCASISDCPTIIEMQSEIDALSGNNENYYTTGATLQGDTIFFDRNDMLSAYSIDLSSIVGSTGSELLSGGFSYLSGLTFEGTPLTYTINGTYYTAAASTVTLLSGDPTFDRIDVIVADISGNTSVVQGTPSLNPVKPDIDESTQLEVTFVTVAAGATTIALASTLVFNEFVGPPTEWTFTTPSAPFIISSTTETYSGVQSIRFSGATTAKSFTLSSSTIFDSTIENTIQFAIKNDIAWAGAVGSRRLRFTILSSTGVQIGTFVDLYNGRFGFSSSNTSTWQLLSIPLSNFALTTVLFSQIKVTTVNTAGNLNCYMDYIRMVEGVPSATPNPAWLNMRVDNGTSIPALVTNDTLTLSGGTNIGTRISGPRTIVFDLDNNIALSSVTATVISASTYLNLPSSPAGFSGWTSSTGNFSIIANNGTGNIAASTYSVVAGKNNYAVNQLSFIGNGVNNYSSGQYTFIGNGYGHKITAGSTFIGGGYAHSGYSQYSAIVHGANNYVGGNYAFIGGGRQNRAEVSYTSIFSGFRNRATNTHSLVVAGANNISSGRYSVVVGGGYGTAAYGNQATGNYSSVVGGFTNHATGYASFIGGGGENVASSNRSAVVAGKSNTASGSRSFVGGGFGNVASLTYGVVVGGKQNNNSSVNGFIGAGASNNASSSYGAIINGKSNIVSSSYSLVGNGTFHLSSGIRSFVGNGLSNSATTRYSSVINGQTNHASGYYSSVIGGTSNRASGVHSSIVGGFGNIASSYRTFIGNGTYNQATTNYATVVGGYRNIASGLHSSILNGYNNQVSGSYSSVIGGINNLAIGNRIVILGGNAITGITDDAAYVPLLNIRDLGTGTSINTLGIDADGFVVSSTTASSFTGWTYGAGANSVVQTSDVPNTATQPYAFATGADTHATGIYSNASNVSSTALGYASHAEGLSTSANASAAHSEGYGVQANGTASHAEGYVTRANGDYTHAGGEGGIANGKWSFIHSTNSFVNGQRSALLGGQNLTGSSDDTVYVPYLNIATATTDNTLTAVLVRAANGDVKISSLTGITSGLTPTLNLQDVTTNGNYTNQGITLVNGGGYEIQFSGGGSANIYNNQLSSSLFINTNGGSIFFGNADGASTLQITPTETISNQQLRVTIITATSISATTYYGISDTFGVSVDGQGGVLSTGVTNYRIMTTSGTITGWNIISSLTGNVVFDVWKTTAGSLPTVANTITDAAKPTLTGALYSASTAISTWTGTTFSAGDVFGFNIDSVTGITKANLIISYLKS